MFRWLKEEWQLAQPTTRVLLVFGAVFSTVLAVAGVVVLRNWQSGINPDTESVEMTEVANRSVSKLQDFKLPGVRSAATNAILDRYLQALGGVINLSQMKSVRAQGELEFPAGEPVRVVVVKREGGMILLTIGKVPSQIVMGVTPREAWRKVWVQGRERVEDMDPEQARSLRRSGHPISKLYMAMQNEWKIQYLGLQEFEGRSAHAFQVQVDPRESARLFIDPDSFLEVGNEDELLGENGQTSVTRHVQSAHFFADGLTVPGKIETYTDGKLSHIFHVRSVEVNPGVLLESFNRPQI